MTNYWKRKHRKKYLRDKYRMEIVQKDPLVAEKLIQSGFGDDHIQGTLSINGQVVAVGTISELKKLQKEIQHNEKKILAVIKE